MIVRAKMKCVRKAENSAGFTVELEPVISGSAENEMFYKYTPGGSVQLSTVNAAAAAAFNVGGSYYVDFTPAE